MRVKVKLRDFINSKYHRESTDFLDGILISHIRLKEAREKYGVDKLTIFPYSIARGKSEVLKFAEFDLGINIHETELTLEFEDFSIWISGGLSTKGLITVLCNVKKVWLPRKSELKLTHYESFMIYDKYYGFYYIFPPNLMLPKKKGDLWRFFQFLRFKKLLLLPGWVNIYRANLYGTFRYLSIQWTVFSDIDTFSECCKIIENARPMVDEFVEWQNNRYKIIV